MGHQRGITGKVSCFGTPTAVDQLIGDPTKAREKLGWAPETLFADLVGRMVDSDMALAEGEARN